MRRQVAILATVIGMTAAAPAASAFEDFSGKDRDSLNIRHLQSQLMVAALSCNLRPQYNATIGRFEAELIRHGRDLRHLFKRTYGKSSERELNRFVTAMANHASVSSLNSGAAYCRDATLLFTEILALPVSSLAVFWDGRADIDRNLLPGPIESAAAPAN
ncbi:MAG: hypothetical protein ACTSX7_04350 [Alphaproteobacteria bacterium]